MDCSNAQDVFNDPTTKQLIQSAINEDGQDVTSSAIFSPNDRCDVTIVSRQEGIVCGLPVIEQVITLLGGKVDIQLKKNDGDIIKQDDVVVEMNGPTITLFRAERIILNFLQHLSGVATTTHAFVEAVAGLNVKILDTRKTMPGFRLLQKYAVRVGGGENHRYGLSDMVLIKENHIMAAGGIPQAVEKVRELQRTVPKMEVEARTLTEVGTLAGLGVRRIMLDNFSLEEARDAVQQFGDKADLEASGGIHLQNVRQYAETGVRYISVGALTHSVKAFDFSMLSRFS